jgi:hypothetical protein
MEHCRLLTDNGSENFGDVTEFVLQTSKPEVKHLVAQLDIEFSNSMIEAANKQLKYCFLYHRHIADINELRRYVKEAAEDYNNRPNNVLDGLTPLEVLKGLKPANYKEQVLQMKAARITENRKVQCNCYSF